VLCFVGFCMVVCVVLYHSVLSALILLFYNIQRFIQTPCIIIIIITIIISIITIIIIIIIISSSSIVIVIIIIVT